MNTYIVYILYTWYIHFIYTSYTHVHSSHFLTVTRRPRRLAVLLEAPPAGYSWFTRLWELRNLRIEWFIMVYICLVYG